MVVITGASAGIGRATAVRLGRSGLAVVAAARRHDLLVEVVREIEQAGGQALAVTADVTREDDVTALITAALERFGRVDVVICNAGFGIYGAIDQIDPDKMRRLIDVNYLGTYHAIRAVLPHFRALNRGHIIVVSSIVGRRGVPQMGAYSATKFAQVGLAECLRAELQGSGISLSLVYPVSTETDFFKVMTAESGFATRAAGPRQSAETVADAIAGVIEKPRPEVYPYRKARGLAVLAVLAPAFCDRLVKKWGREPIAT